MRRLIIIGTALAVLGGATAAFAATYFNSYPGSKLIFNPKVAGSSSHPKGVGETEILKASAPSGDRAAPLTDIKTTVYGLKLNGAKMPKCTDAMIEANTTKYDASCPKGSMIASGPVHSLLGPASDPSIGKGTACNPFLHIYNGGKNTQVFFFITSAQYSCGGLRTGATAPYDGHISYQGKNLVVDVPLPPDISNKVANQVGLYGSLITETLTYPKSTGYTVSVACGKGGKRSWSIQYTAQDYSGGAETQTVKGTDKC